MNPAGIPRPGSFIGGATGLIRTIHAFPSVVVVSTSVAMVLIAHGGNPGIGLLTRAAIVVAASQVAVGSLNDFVDRTEDAVAQPDKPIPSGLVSPRAVLVLVVAGIIALIIVAASLGVASLVFASIGTASGIAYDLWLKRTPVSVLAYVISFLSLATWAWAIAGHFTPRFFLTYPAGAVLVLAAHLANSYPDIETDRTLGHRGLATLLGPVWTYRVIVDSYAAVWLAGVVLAVIVRRPQSVGLLLLSGVALSLAATTCRQAPSDPQLRERLFRIVAPGLGLLALGCLVAIAP